MGQSSPRITARRGPPSPRKLVLSAPPAYINLVRQTEHGTLMVTSLANFRSDYTIVPVPSGVFLEARDHLYTNINLLRMGCSGRMALTLQEPRRAQFQKSVSSQKE
jgi:hypothetical protein